MKIVLLSILISFSFIVFLVTVAFSLETLGIIDEETSMNLAVPFRLPAYIYEDILGFEVTFSESEDDFTYEEAKFVFYAMLFNVILYAFVSYIIIRSLKKFIGSKKKNKLFEKPPKPPVFVDSDKYK